jgi:ornithine cyclodeaminase/alanine dehydrogenase
MPALKRADLADTTGELLGIKWVTGFPTNIAAGLTAIHATIILSDAQTGLPRAIIDGGGLTAHRTAGVSGVAVARWGTTAGTGARVALVGAGTQARSHLPVIEHLLPDAELVLCDRDLSRADALAGELGGAAGRRPVRTTAQPSEAVAGADLVLTLISFGPEHQALPEEAFEPAATVVAVDYDMCVPASLAVAADLFLVDQREQYLANRTATVFAGYPERATTMGEAIHAGTIRPGGRVLVTHLGVGLADVVFADAVLRTAEASGIGTVLPR